MSNPHGTRPTLRRLNQIAWLILHRKGTNMQTLARDLQCSVKTIQRDIDLLRDSLGHQIEYDASHYCFRYTARPLSLSDPKRRMLL